MHQTHLLLHHISHLSRSSSYITAVYHAHLSTALLLRTSKDTFSVPAEIG